MRVSDRDQERASPSGSGVGGNVNRRVITSTGEFLDASRTGGILPILVRPGAIHAELIRAHLGPIVADAVYCSLPLALRGETAADRVCLVVPMKRTGSGQLNGEPLIPGNLLAFGGSAEVAGASGAPLQCGMLSVASSALERTATALGIKSHPPGEGEFRVAPVVDRGRLSRAFDLLSGIVNHRKTQCWQSAKPTRSNRAFLGSPFVRWPAIRVAARCINLLASRARRSLVPARTTRGNRGTRRDTRRPLQSVRRVGAASPLRLLRVLPDVAHRLPACHRAQRGTARTSRRTRPTRCRQPCRDGLGLLAPQPLRRPISGAVRRVTQPHPRPSSGSTRAAAN